MQSMSDLQWNVVQHANLKKDGQTLSLSSIETDGDIINNTFVLVDPLMTIFILKLCDKKMNTDPKSFQVSDKRLAP